MSVAIWQSHFHSEMVCDPCEQLGLLTVYRG
jgi:hypothetical protein